MHAKNTKQYIKIYDCYFNLRLFLFVGHGVQITDTDMYTWYIHREKIYIPSKPLQCMTQNDQ